MPVLLGYHLFQKCREKCREMYRKNPQWFNAMEEHGSRINDRTSPPLEDEGGEMVGGVPAVGRTTVGPLITGSLKPPLIIYRFCDSPSR